MRAYLSRWLPVIGYAGLIFYLSHRSTPPRGAALIPDKLAHAILYAGFGFLLARALTKTRGLSKISAGAIAVVSAGLYGVTDEWHQSFIPQRSVEAADVLADFIGAFFGVMAYYCIGMFAARLLGGRLAGRQQRSIGGK